MNKYITSNPNIFAGAPVITGTRIPVVRIMYLIKNGLSIDEIQEHYPHVSRTTLEGVIDEVAQLVTNTNASVL